MEEIVEICQVFFAGTRSIPFSFWIHIIHPAGCIRNMFVFRGRWTYRKLRRERVVWGGLWKTAGAAQAQSEGVWYAYKATCPYSKDGLYWFGSWCNKGEIWVFSTHIMTVLLHDRRATMIWTNYEMWMQNNPCHKPIVFYEQTDRKVVSHFWKTP